jgi:hypothetical protein
MILAMVPALRVVRDRGGIVPDVGGQPGRRLDQPRQAGIAAGQGGGILSQCADARQRLVGVAVPQPPLDPLQPILQGGCFKGVVVSQALGVLPEPGQPHGNMEPVQMMRAAGRQVADGFCQLSGQVAQRTGV